MGSNSVICIYLPTGANSSKMDTLIEAPAGSERNMYASQKISVPYLRDLQRAGRAALAGLRAGPGGRRMSSADLRGLPAAPRLGPQAFAYESCDIPIGMTISEFQATRAARRPRRRRWLGFSGRDRRDRGGTRG